MPTKAGRHHVEEGVGQAVPTADPAADGARAVDVRLHGELEDFLPAARRGSVQRRPIVGRPGAKDVLEAVGVPHPEIAILAINGAPGLLADRLAPGDRVDAYPPGWRGPSPAPVPPVSARPDGEARFVLDGHLGRLAAYLRMCGFDTAYSPGADDVELAGTAVSEDRVLLTRDLGLLKRGVVRWGAIVRHDRPADQLAEVLARYGLAGHVRPFVRCLRCNRLLEDVGREDVRDAVPPRVFREQASFRRCPGCGGIYWRGSHHARMIRLLERTRAANARGPQVR